MKKFFASLIFLLLIHSFQSQAQNIAIGTNGAAPHTSAMLDVNSSDKGLLIPRIPLTGADDINTIPNPATSLLIYNTAIAGSGINAIDPGFYFWNGSAWSKLMTATGSISSSWTLGGNIGTNPSANFIGTVDSIPLQFRVNNKPSGKIDLYNVNTFFGYQAGKSMTSGWGSIGIGQNALKNTTAGVENIAIGENTLQANATASDNIAIGKFTMANFTTGTGNVTLGNFALQNNTSGVENTVVGRAALYTDTTGFANTVMGYNGMFNNKNGHSNTAIGRTALNGNTSGFENVAVGRSALFNNSTGSQNTGVGRNALTSNGTGTLVTALGFQADVGAANLINATAIGARSFANCGNCVVLGSSNGINGAVSDVNVGISVPDPTQPLSFKNVLGGKVSFWNGGSGHYGFGIQNGLFQVYTDIQASDIAFGWGKSETFNETMRIKNSGLVGIGNNAPVHVLDIKTNSTLSKVHLRLHEDENEFARMRFTNTTGGNFWDIAGKPDVTNAGAALNFYYSALGRDVLSLSGTGNALLAGVLTENSDGRLKKNITRIENPLEKLLQLNGYNYNWIDKNRDPALQTGVIAQEVQQLFPNLVKEDAKGMLSVNYSGLVPVLIEAIKEQQKQIDELKKIISHK